MLKKKNRVKLILGIAIVAVMLGIVFLSTDYKKDDDFVIEKGTLTEYKKDDDFVIEKGMPTEYKKDDDFVIEKGMLTEYKGSSQVVKIPKDVQKIGKNAFSENNKIIKVILQGCVTEIQENAFYRCKNLEEVIFSKKLVYIGDGAFTACKNLKRIKLPESVMEIGNYAFHDCVELEEIVLPERLTSIGRGAFASCKKLRKIKLPDSITEVESFIFRDCEKLSQVILPKNTVSIGDQVFVNCKRLRKIDIPNSVKSIGYGAFANCKVLRKIKIPEAITSIDATTFSNCKELTEIRLPKNITSIGRGAFERCIKLKRIEIPDSVIEMGKYVFFGCWELEEVLLSKNIINIDMFTFAYCEALKEIEIPSSVKSIAESVFEGCGKLVEIKVSDDVEGKENLPKVGEKRTVGDIFACRVNDKNETLDCEILSINQDGTGGTVCVGGFFMRDCPENCNIPSVVWDRGLVYKVIQVEEDHSEHLWWHFGEETEPEYGDDAKKIIIPKGVQKIGGGICFQSQVLKEVYIPETVKEIGVGAFSMCNNVDIFIIDEKNPYYKYEDGMIMSKDGTKIISAVKRSDEVKIPEGVTEIEDFAFFENKIKKIKLSSTIKIIGKNAFNKNNFQDIEFYEGLEEIKDYAFKSCKKLKSVVLPHSLNDLGKGAFKNCLSLADITIGNNLKEIENNTFRNCIALKAIVIPSNVTTIGRAAFACNCDQEQSTHSSLNKVSLPSTLKTIKAEAFAGNGHKKLKITVPKGTELIGEGAFYQCKDVVLEKGNKNYIQRDGMILTKDEKTLKYYHTNKIDAVLPDYIQKVEYGSIYGERLKKVTFPKNMTSLRIAGIELEEMRFQTKKPPEIEDNTDGIYQAFYPFYRKKNKRIKIIVPRGSKNAYEDAYFKRIKYDVIYTSSGEIATANITVFD